MLGYVRSISRKKFYTSLACIYAIEISLLSRHCLRSSHFNGPKLFLLWEFCYGNFELNSVQSIKVNSRLKVTMFSSSGHLILITERRETKIICGY